MADWPIGRRTRLVHRQVVSVFAERRSSIGERSAMGVVMSVWRWHSCSGLRSRSALLR